MSQVSVKIRPFHIFILTIVLLLIFQEILAVPGVYRTSLTDSQDPRQNNPGFFSRLTSRIIEDCVRIASRLWQWLPQFPDWMKPSKPTMMLVKPTSRPLRDKDFSSEEID